MKRFLLLACLLCHWACDIDFEDNRRLLIKGRIVDSEGNPRARVATILTATGDVFTETIGSAKTDGNGNFSMTTLSPSNAGYLRLAINEGASFTESSYEFLFRSPDLVEHTFDVATLTVDEKITATLRLVRSSSNNDTLFYGIRIQDMVTVVSPSLTDDFRSFCKSTGALGDTLLPMETSKEMSVEVIPGADICIGFRFTDDFTDEGNNVLLKPTSANEYVFEF